MNDLSTTCNYLYNIYTFIFLINLTSYFFVSDVLLAFYRILKKINRSHNKKPQKSFENIFRDQL